MCVVSMVQDHYRDRWPTSQPSTTQDYMQVLQNWPAGPTRAEFDELKRMVLAAQEIDKVTGQPDCEKRDINEWLSEVEARVQAIEDMANATEAEKQDVREEIAGGIMISDHLSREAQIRISQVGIRLSTFNQTMRSEELDEIGRDIALICRDFAQPAHRATAQFVVDTYDAVIGDDRRD